MSVSRPVIGITTQNLQTLDNIPASLPPSWVMSRRVIEAVVEAGGVPLMIPLLEGEADRGTLRLIYEQLDGILIPGGADPEPSTYGAARLELCERSDPPRDRVELSLLEWAVEDGKPVLGICRGLQMINVAAGGTLHQDVAAERPGPLKHDFFPGQGFARDRLSHTVALEPASRVRDAAGEDELSVNSMHHQGIRDLGGGLRVTAHAPDGLIEAIEGPDQPFLVGVQWHPEELSRRPGGARRLFEAFLDAARAYRGARHADASPLGSGNPPNG